VNRRTLLRTIGVGVVAAPLAARAQQPGRVWRIGLFHVGLDHVPPALHGLREGLKELGYEEGKNLRWDFRNLPDESAAQETAREFVREKVDVIVAFENQTVRAAKAATSEVPILFLHVLTDPVGEGFVQSLAHPGGNITGIFGDVPGKRVELLKEAVPTLDRLLLLFDPTDHTARQGAWLGAQATRRRERWSHRREVYQPILLSLMELDIHSRHRLRLEEENDSADPKSQVRLNETIERAAAAMTEVQRVSAIALYSEMTCVRHSMSLGRNG
jgi:hypothetical protein